MTTEAPTAGTETTDTAPAAPIAGSPETLLTEGVAAPEAPVQGQAEQPTQAEGAAPEGDKPAEQGKPEGAPEEYADFTAPEGASFNPETMADLKALAKEHNLTQEAAQKFADLGAQAVQKVEAGFRDQIAQAQAQWAESSRTDKEFGGDNLAANVSVAKQALDTFGSPELTAMLKDSGLGNHPEIIRAFYRVGKAISEDRMVGATKRPTTADPAKTLFPNMN